MVQNGGEGMKTTRIIVALPESIKRKLDGLRAQGATASGFIRWLLEQHFKQVAGSARKGR